MPAATGARRRVWLAVAAWAGLIWVLSSGWFSGPQTGGFLLPLLQAVLPGASPEELRALHGLLRKAAHVVEYLVLGVLLMRALRTEGLRGAALAGTATALGIAWAGLDELHQSFVPTRTGSPRDVLVDAVGVLAGVGLAALRAAGPAPRPAADRRPAEN